MTEKLEPELADETRTDLLPTPDCATYSDSGIDLSLARWLLSLTYMQRLDTLQNHVDFVATAKHVSPRAPGREHIPDTADSRG